MSDDIQIEPEPGESRREFSRRRLIRNVGIAGVGVPALSALLAACTGGATADASSGGGPYPGHKKYKFTLVNHVTTNSFFTPTRFGADDACELLGCSYNWTGSENSIVSEMVNAMNSAITSKVDGIGVPVIDKTAFTGPTKKALSEGIPVISYNANPPVGSDTPVMSYIGQDLTAAGTEAGKRILQQVKAGDTVACMIATPGTGNIQPRADGAKAVLEDAGVKFVQVATGAAEGAELSAVEAWFQGHQNAKFLYAVDAGSGIAVAKTVAKYASTGVKGSGWDVGTPTLQQVKDKNLDFTIDQQAYLQGFLSILQLFLYNVSGGLVAPVETNTGLKFVTSSNVGPYLNSKNRFEGASSTKKVLSAPSSIQE
ncbi:substrate-binding domain-containing protein [Humibacter albus]|jgi:simple sugar transport system substrate-binding protein|uniref:substrate-binding domain-containing protein n=1 Tax=Humibacter albus TaxID=427754 RepID=UPI0003B313EA|nr:substrate-binding domain-containing protein [Humibacter albus]